MEKSCIDLLSPSSSYCVVCHHPVGGHAPANICEDCFSQAVNEAREADMLGPICLTRLSRCARL